MREQETGNKEQGIDILILSNGPGEVTTWVRPVVKALREKFGSDRDRLRISVVLSPCPNATGKEADIARSYPEVDRVQRADHFFPFLLWGRSVESWDWRPRGLLLFLGGDQAFAAIIAKRLGYRTLVYAEWEARWYRWIDRFAVRQAAAIEGVPAPYRPKLTVVGDLMVDLPTPLAPATGTAPLVGLMPGSKAGKLAQGVPLCLAIAHHIQRQRPDTRFVLPLAPTLTPCTLAAFADPAYNPLVAKMGGIGAQLKLPNPSESSPYLETSGGLKVQLWEKFPAHEVLCRCWLVLTTVGANTAELGALGIPMLVLLPTQQLDAMRTWDGIPGILARLPGLGSAFAKLINWVAIRQNRLYAWPNIWAKEVIVPELVGELQAADIAQQVIDGLEHPEKLQKIRDRLVEVRGDPGAAQHIAQIAYELIV
jgi:lipid-A-disaccharide synthase